MTGLDIKKVLVLVAATATIVVAIAFKPWRSSGPTQADIAAGAAPAASCSFSVGQTAAFRFSSTVTAEGQSDTFEGVMSWQVEALNDGVARVRAAFDKVNLSQDMTLAAERAVSPQGLPFFLQVDSNCSITGTAFATQWQPKSRLLVATQLDNFTFLLPPAGVTQWQSSALDGLGDYTAHFSVLSQAPLQIQRHKTDHLIRGAADSFGIKIAVHKSQATAMFNPSQPLWWQAISGEEIVSLQVAGQPEVMMQQRFSLQRDDQLFAAIAQTDWALAEKSVPYDLAPEFDEFTTQQQSYTETYAAFISAITDTPPRYFDAALEMAAWLKKHPEDVDLLVAELRGQMADDARPTAFLALQLSGLNNAREALSDMMFDTTMSQGDQSRAASALADLGTPRQDVAELLLSRAMIKDIGGNASLLGAGSMVARSTDPALRQYIMQSLQQQLVDTSDQSERLILIDSMGNTGDASFVEVLSHELSAESEATRRRAADAISRLPAEQARPALLDALEQESDPQVSTALIDALKHAGASSPELLDVLEKRVSSPDANQRAATIDLLGAQQTERAQQLLIAQYKRETDARIKMQIGRYVPAKALR
jgi:hypothetical protein